MGTGDEIKKKGGGGGGGGITSGRTTGKAKEASSLSLSLFDRKQKHRRHFFF